MSADPPDFTCPHGHRIPEQRFDPQVGCIVVDCPARKGRPAVLRLVDCQPLDAVPDGFPEDAVEEVEGEETVEGTTTTSETLRNFIERVERLDDEMAELRADRSDVMKEAKSCGFDMPAFREVIRRRKMDPHTRAELDDIVATYECALGHVPRGFRDGGDLTPAPLPVQRKVAAKEKAMRDALALTAASRAVE